MKIEFHNYWKAKTFLQKQSSGDVLQKSFEKTFHVLTFLKFKNFYAI